ncbi:GDSL-type esterase/lipase family protein [Salinithrix halophila]|uniref:GDSL-type esterase/lipase family protein n=2 Tax=Salinithrix halophila TaxID=1485204 RepID=A0ABV8J9A5_9BACL
MAGAFLIVILLTGITGQLWPAAWGSDKRMVALGDSLTYGYGDRLGNGYVDSLEERLNEKYEKTFTIKNYGIRGQETDGVLKQLAHWNIQQEVKKADTVILFIGTNDLINIETPHG